MKLPNNLKLVLKSILVVLVIMLIVLISLGGGLVLSFLYGFWPGLIFIVLGGYSLKTFVEWAS